MASKSRPSWYETKRTKFRAVLLSKSLISLLSLLHLQSCSLIDSVLFSASFAISNFQYLLIGKTNCKNRSLSVVLHERQYCIPCELVAVVSNWQTTITIKRFLPLLLLVLLLLLSYYLFSFWMAVLTTKSRCGPLLSLMATSFDWSLPILAAIFVRLSYVKK